MCTVPLRLKSRSLVRLHLYRRCIKVTVLSSFNVSALSSVSRLFQSVAQCCMGQKQAQQVMEGTGAS